METVAKYLRAVVISIEKKVTEVLPEVSGVQNRKWVRRKRVNKNGGIYAKAHNMMNVK